MNPLFACKSFACNFIGWLEVFGVDWLEDVSFMNQSESPTAGLVQGQSTLEFSNRRYRNMLSPRRLTVLWLACVMARADDEACALQKALGKPKIRDKLSESIWKGFRDYRAIGAIRWNKPLNHRRTAVWRSELCRWLQVGCQGRAPWITRSGRPFQWWYNSRQCPGTLGLWKEDDLPSELNFAVFGHSLCDHGWHHQGLPRDTDCTGPQSWIQQLVVDCRRKVTFCCQFCACNPPPQSANCINKTMDSWGALAAILMSHFLLETGMICGERLESVCEISGVKVEWRVPVAMLLECM